MACALLGEIPDMKTANPFPFRSQLGCGGAILAQRATFLPVPSAQTGRAWDLATPEQLCFTVFLPIFDYNRKKLTVARPLLKDQLQ